MRRAERHGGGEVIDDLRDDAGPVDRIDAGQPHAVAEARVVEHALHQRLAIVEGALDGDRVHVLLARRRHLPPLHRRDAAVGKEDEDVGALRGRGTPRSRRRRCRPRSRRRSSRARRARQRTWSMSRARNCIARSLKASVGPWNSSSRKWFGPIWTSGATASWRKVGRRRRSCASSAASAISPPTKRLMMLKAISA